MKNKCSKCKIQIDSGRYCTECYEKLKREQIQKAINRKKAKYYNTETYALTQLKSHVATIHDWSSCHSNCFRASVKLSKSGRSGENLKHVKKKFDRWLYHRQLGRTVFTELRLKQGRPDLVIITKDGETWIEEIVNTETEAKLIEKEAKYPFKIVIVRC